MNKKIGFILLMIMGMTIWSDTPTNKIVKTREIVLNRNDLGSIANPVKCDGDQGEVEYLQRLRCPSGRQVKYRRISHAYPDPKGHVLDIYEIKSKDETTRVEIYMDMNWPGYIENQPIKEFEIKTSKSPGNIVYKFETPPLTARDVYQMVIDYGFYCEIPGGNNFHAEGLKGINTPRDSIFPLRRTIFTEKKNEKRIETWSKINFTPRKGIDTNIRLFWYYKIESCTFENAVNIVENLNREQKGGFSEWRIPTLTELFSIVDNSKLHFSGEFEFPKGETLTFWTATPVCKKGTVLEYEKSEKAYYVIALTYNNQTNQYSLSFTIRDVKGKNKKEAYLLPVFSEITYAYRSIPPGVSPSPVSSSPAVTPPGFDTKKAGQTNPSQVSNIPGLIPQPPTTPPSSGSVSPKQKTTANDKIPGFDDTPVSPRQSPAATSPQPSSAAAAPPKTVARTDSIPGFDDVPDPTGTSSTPPKAPRTVNVALIPFLQKGMIGGNEQQLLVLIDDEIEKVLNTLNLDLQSRFNISIKIDKKDPNDQTNWDQITRLYDISSDQSLSENDRIKRFKLEIMGPHTIDIIVTVVTDLNNLNLNFNSFEPTIISGINGKIYSKQLLQKASDRFSSLTGFVGDTIKTIVSQI